MLRRVIHQDWIKKAVVESIKSVLIASSRLARCHMSGIDHTELHQTTTLLLMWCRTTAWALSLCSDDQENFTCLNSVICIILFKYITYGHETMMDANELHQCLHVRWLVHIATVLISHLIFEGWLGSADWWGYASHQSIFSQTQRCIKDTGCPLEWIVLSSLESSSP
jgi:hypothetical protein